MRRQLLLAFILVLAQPCMAVEDLYLKGKEAYEQGRYPEAIKLLSAYREKHLNELKKHKESLDQIDKALADAKQTIEAKRSGGGMSNSCQTRTHMRVSARKRCDNAP